MKTYMQKTGFVYLVHNYESDSTLRKALSELDLNDTDYLAEVVHTSYKVMGSDDDIPKRMIEKLLQLNREGKIAEDDLKQVYYTRTKVNRCSDSFNLNPYLRQDCLMNIAKAEGIPISDYFSNYRTITCTEITEDVWKQQSEMNKIEKTQMGYDPKFMMKMPIQITYEIPDGKSWVVGLHRKIMKHLRLLIRNRIFEKRIMNMEVFISDAECKEELVTKTESSCSERFISSEEGDV